MDIIKIKTIKAAQKLKEEFKNECKRRFILFRRS